MVEACQSLCDPAKVTMHPSPPSAQPAPGRPGQGTGAAALAGPALAAQRYVVEPPVLGAGGGGGGGGGGVGSRRRQL